MSSKPVLMLECPECNSISLHETAKVFNQLIQKVCKQLILKLIFLKKWEKMELGVFAFCDVFGFCKA